MSSFQAYKNLNIDICRHKPDFDITHHILFCEHMYGTAIVVAYVLQLQLVLPLFILQLPATVASINVTQ